MGGSVSKRQIEFNDHVDLEKCMGKWYFIASNGTPFERGHRNSTQTYIMRPDGKVDVLYEANRHSVNGPHNSNCL